VTDVDAMRVELEQPLILFFDKKISAMAILGDFAVLTGARVISADVGDLLDKVTIDDLGECAKLVVDKDATTIIDGAGDDQLIEAKRQEIRGQIENTTSDWDREKLGERLARPSEGVAIIRVGALTEVDMKRRKEAFDDAIASTRAPSGWAWRSLPRPSRSRRGSWRATVAWTTASPSPPPCCSPMRHSRTSRIRTTLRPWRCHRISAEPGRHTETVTPSR
jgi:hypothetical protein